MKADMLASQFDALEEPDDALVIDVSAPPTVIVKHILSQLRMPSHGGAIETPDKTVNRLEDQKEPRRARLC